MLDHPHYFDLSGFALIEITGNDAFAFLHGQITGDLNEINSRGWMFSAWCQANGRVICTFIVYRHNNSLFLILPTAMKDRIIRRLSMFVLRADVTIRDAGGDHALLGIFGIHIGDPEIPGPCTRTGKMLVAEPLVKLELWGLTPRCIIICKGDTPPRLLEKIRTLCKEGEMSTWNLLDIEAGIPWITETTSEAFLPQMLNLDQIHGLSYQKSCYPGQEVIARLHHRGELKRKMFLGTGHGDILPSPGAALERSDTGAKTGAVINVEHHPDGGYRVLVIADIHEASNLMRLQGAQQTSISLQPLHYPA